MRDYCRMIERIKRDEGFRPLPYVCSTDHWTIGYGTRFLFTGRGFLTVNQHTEEVTRFIAEQQLICAVHKAMKEASLFVNNFQQLSSVRQCVLTMMAYQLGGQGLYKFKRTKEFIECLQWQKARNEMLDSLWARQTPDRAERTADMFYLEKWL